jgi:hypothetical protein
MRHCFPILFAFVLASLSVGCATGSDGGDGDGDGDGDTADAGVDVSYDVDAEPRCSDGTRFEAGGAAFVERTAEVGLAALAVEGTRLSVADIDGDGRPDLFVRRGGNRADDFDIGPRNAWLLKNTGTAFVDVTEESGVGTPRGTGTPSRAYEVVAFADVDNDGDLDLYSGLATDDDGVANGETSELYLNDGSGVFSLAAASDIRRSGEIDMPAGATFVDVNHDGLIDLFVGEHNYSTAGGGVVFQHDRLYLGQGDGTFDDITTTAGLVTEGWSSTTVLNDGRAHSRAWATGSCDLNDDGFADLFVASYGRSPNHLWRGGAFAGQPSFANISVASGYAYDDDRTWQDNQFARCYCQANPAAEGCAGLPAPLVSCGSPNWDHTSDRQAYRLGGNSATTLCGDVDNDGDLDLFTTEIKHWWAGAGSDGSEWLLNDGLEDVTFTRPGDAALGLAIDHVGTSWDEGHMTAALLDFDNDGWLDLYVGASDYAGNRGLLYHQGEPLAFSEVDPLDGIDHHRSHGVAVLDFDGDGDQDVVVGHSRARCDPAGDFDCYETPQVRYFENVLGQSGNWLQLKLIGTTANTSAIGARVVVETADGVKRTSEVTAGHGHYGMQSDLVQHIGLGPSCEATVTITWPTSDRRQESYFLPAGYRIEITEGAGARLAGETP